nr:unnamed protein product [Callosobruchus analis]
MAGKHVAITKTESYYYNYKKNFSIVLLAVVNSNYEFYDSYRYNGTISDGGVLSSTSCGKKTKHYSQTGLTAEQRIFNYRPSLAERIVEKAFGILVSIFGVFQRPIALSPEKAQVVVLTCCYLHNYLRKR